MLLVNVAIFAITLGCCYCIGCIFMWIYCWWLSKKAVKKKRNIAQIRVAIYDQESEDNNGRIEEEV